MSSTLLSSPFSSQLLAASSSPSAVRLDSKRSTASSTSALMVSGLSSILIQAAAISCMSDEAVATPSSMKESWRAAGISEKASAAVLSLPSKLHSWSSSAAFMDFVLVSEPSFAIISEARFTGRISALRQLLRTASSSAYFPSTLQMPRRMHIASRT
eukprot:scaffold3091_cov154-Pinguiococcus_pyrenoidosus.AAC.1